MRLFLKTISVLAILIAVFLAGSGLSMAHHGSVCPMTVVSSTGCPEQTRHSFSAGAGLCYEVVTRDVLKTPTLTADYLPAPQPLRGTEIIPSNPDECLSGKDLKLLRITGVEAGRKQIGLWIALHEKKDDADLV